MNCYRRLGPPSFLVLLISVLSLNGCIVGAYRVTAPDRLPPTSLRPLTRPISFDVCVPMDFWPPSHSGTERQELGARVRSALALAGISAELESSAGSTVDFTITRHVQRSGEGWAYGLSLLTLSVVPGHRAQSTTLDVELAPVDVTQVRTSEHLQYQSRSTLFFWLPLIVHPDVVESFDGGWESSEKADAAFNQMIGRLGDDIRVRLGRDGETPPTSNGNRVVCP